MSFKTRLFFAPAIALAALSAAAPAPQEDDPVFVDEEKKELLDKIAKCRAATDWKALFDLYSKASLPKNAHKLVRLPGPEPRFIGLLEHMNRSFADLPPEALLFYRGQHDGAARREFDRARAAGDLAALEHIVNTWFYSSRTDDALDLLANIHLEEGRLPSAIHCWSRLLYHYPDSEIPRPVTAARLASVAAMAGNDGILEGVRRHVKEKNVEGEVIVGPGPTSLQSFLAGLAIVPPPAGPAPVVREPLILPPRGSRVSRLTGVRPEVLRWSAELTEGARPEAGPKRTVTRANDFPFISAYASIDDHEMVVYTNGIKVTAIDPERASSERQDDGVYFTYPTPGESVPRQLVPADVRSGNQQPWVRPYIGVTIDGEHAFATLYSGKWSADRQAGGGGGWQDNLYGTKRIVCINLRTQRVLWDTDYGDAGAQFRKLDFWDRNFSISGPPLVRGDRVYLGIGMSPAAPEEESRVVCLDRRTGVPLWDRFLASVSNPGRGWWGGGGGGSLMSRLTVIDEDRGSLIAHTNLGVIATLDSVTGQVRWLSKYSRTGVAPRQGWGDPSAIFSRPASPLVLHRGRVYALSQDAPELLIADLATGAIQKNVPRVETSLATRTWKEFSRLTGRMGDYLVLGGAAGVDTCVFDTTNNRSFGLPETSVAGTGRGLVEGETVYLPCTSGGQGGLGIYHGLRNWSPFERSKLWWHLGEGGNLARAGNYLVLTSTTKIMVWTDIEMVRAEFRRRLEQSPPNPAAWLDYGVLMRSNRSWSEAARGYLSFLEAVAGDPEWMGRAREVRTELHGIFVNLGVESAGRKLHSDAAAHYRRARDFAWDAATLAETTRLLAGACESAAESTPVPADRLAWARRGVEEYQELIRRAPRGFVRPGDTSLWLPTVRLASRRIATILKVHGPEAYAGVERAAREELKKIGAGTPDALKAFADLYPNSAAAVEVLDRLVDQSASQGRWGEAASALRGLRDRLGDRWTPARQLRLHEALEKAGDAERFEAEVGRMERVFDANTKIGPEENSPTVGAYVAKAREAAVSLARRPAEAAPSSTATLSTWDAPVEHSGATRQRVGWDLIAPGGLEPPKWSPDLEFFARGSTVELWNVRTKKRVWTAAHPGGWTGLSFSERSDPGLGVRVTEILPDSPAEKAGLRVDDLILTVDGAEADEETFDLATEGRPAGTKLSIAYRRVDQNGRAELTTAPWPAESRPGIVGAVFTADGMLAVAWEDAVAAFDVADGRTRWMSRPSRDRFTLRAIHACAGRVLVHEHLLPSRNRSSFRTLGERIARAGLPSEDQHSRVIALDESDGAPVWAVALKFEAATASHHTVRFLGRPLDARPAVLVGGFLNTQKEYEIVPLSAEDGAEGRRIKLSTVSNMAGPAVTVDPRTGVIWTIEATAQNKRTLRSFTPDYRRDLEIQLDKDLDPLAMVFGLAADGDRVAVTSILRPQNQQATATSPRIAVYSAKDGSLLASHRPSDGPLKDRLNPPAQVASGELRFIGGLVSLEPDGLILVYSESKPAPQGPGGPRRATLTALKIADRNFVQAWEAVTPTLTTQGLAMSDALTVRSGPTGFFVTTVKGIPPGATDEATVVAFHSRKEEGAVKKLFDDLVTRTDTFGNRLDPAPARRGRIFLHRKGGVEILGE